MKAYWQKRLLKIENLEERRLLRDVLLAAFEGIEAHTNEQLEAIKQRVFDENKADIQQFDIYTSLVSMNEYDPINDFLFPMNENDLQQLPFDATVITETNAVGEKPILGKLYFELDYLKLMDIKQTLPKRRFKGQLETNQDVYEIEISLVPYQGYIKQIEKLYELHLENNIPWRTVLHPSIYKFMEMQLETEIAFKEQEKIEAIIIDLEELDAYKQINQIPLWNIRVEAFNNEGYPMPLDDRDYFEHLLILEEGTRESDYLIEGDSEGDDIISTRSSAEGFVLISTQQVISDWKLWQIVKPLTSDLNMPNLRSNRKVDSFIGYFARRSGRSIRTKGEIYRLACSFEEINELKLVGIEMNRDKVATYETYDVNSFIKDEIRIDDDKKIMTLMFKAEKITPFTLDILSFLTSEIALYFPEVKCVGELI